MSNLEATSANPDAPRSPGKMRRTCTGCFVALLIVGVLLGIGGFFLYQKVQSSRVELEPFIKNDLTAALQPIDRQKLKSISSPTMSEDLDTTQAQKLLTAFQQRLGPLKSIDTENADYRFNYTPSGTVGSYAAKCEFEKADGSINIEVVKNEEIWQLTSLKINSSALIP